MDINATLFGQMITFCFFVWFTMKFVWPPMQKALDERRAQIAEGLAAAERGREELAAAQARALSHMHEAKLEAAKLVETTQFQVERMLDEARKNAQIETQRILEKASAEIAQMEATLKAQLQERVAALAIMGAEKILSRTIDPAAHSGFLHQLAKEL